MFRVCLRLLGLWMLWIICCYGVVRCLSTGVKISRLKRDAVRFVSNAEGRMWNFPHLRHAIPLKGVGQIKKNHSIYHF